MAIQFYPLVVRSVSTETPEAYTITFENPDPELFAYRPGQYLTLKVPVGGEVLRRAFSLSSAPGEDGLSVTIKALADGRVSRHLRQTLEPGDQVEVMPPMGKFALTIDPSQARHFVLIGSGSGITPLMSMLKTVLRDEPRSQVTLLYGNRHETSIIFKQELDALEQAHPGRFRVVHVLSQPKGSDYRKGRLEGALLLQLIEQAQLATQLATGYYLCGPEGMMAAAKAVLADLQVPSAEIFTEYYSAPVATEDADEEEYEFEIVTQQVQVILDGKERTVTVQPEQSILHAVLDAGMDAPFACEEGVCCTCRAKLYAGTVSMDEREGLSDEELEAGYILTCQSHPLTSDVRIEYG